MTNPLCLELLRLGGKAHEAVDFPLGEKLHGFRRTASDPIDLRAGIETDVGHHAGEKDMLRRSELEHGDGLSLQVTDRTDALGAEQLEAAGVQPREDDDRVARFNPDDRRPGKLIVDVGLAGGERNANRSGVWFLYVF